MEDHTPQSLRMARQLRQDMSLPEGLLWNRLKRKPLGVKFRNQHPLDHFVLDFYCAAKKLAFEIDGIGHEMGNRPHSDAFRDERLQALGISVVRIPAADVLANVDSVAEGMARLCLASPPPSALRAATSPTGGEFTRSAG
jgi:very-short-patch-repair endonuclease